MDSAGESDRSIVRSALFVDFDNIFISLRDDNPSAAEAFATNPMRWIDWLVELNWRGQEAAEKSTKRAILLQKCYLNPASFGKFRPYFTRAAFEVVDCPSLTGYGKNSGDIHMVLDILDTLNHATHFDEFIILSGDADFTPVLLRLRTHDRRTVILTGAMAAQAYRAAADYVIDADSFVEEALGHAGAGEARDQAAGELAGTVSKNRLATLASKLYEVASASGEILAPSLARDVFIRFPDFKDSDWYGFLSLRRLVDELVTLRDDLEVVEGDPWLVRVKQRPSQRATPSRATPAPAAKTTDGENEQVRRLVAATLERASEPVTTGAMAQVIIDAMGSRVIDSQWFGHGTFRALLEQLLPEPDLRFASEPPGYVYDPQRHAAPEAGSAFETQHPDIAELANRLYQIAGVPRLQPEDYGALFRAVANEVSANGFQLNETSKSVRDRLIEEGRSVSRASVAFVVRGIRFGGVDLRSAPASEIRPEVLARVFRDNVVELCEGAQLELSNAERELLGRWLEQPPD